MKQLLGFLLIILGIALGLYVGVWVMFIGGIVQIVQSCTPTVIALGIAWGLLKVICASVVGWICFGIIAGIGAHLLQ